MQKTDQIAIVENKESLQGILSSIEQDMLNIMPSFMSPERMIKLALVAASRTPLLYQCSKVSIMQAMMTAAELGLDISGQFNSAHLIPFWSTKKDCYEAVFVPGYGGLQELARRSGVISNIRTCLVHDGDYTRYEEGLEQTLVHRPVPPSEQGPVIAAYCVWRHKSEAQVEWMWKEEVDAIRELSRNKDGIFWTKFYSAMARKTVFLRAAKWMPLSSEDRMAISLAVGQENEVMGTGAVIEAEVTPADGRFGFGKKKGHVSELIKSESIESVTADNDTIAVKEQVFAPDSPPEKDTKTIDINF